MAVVVDESQRKKAKLLEAVSGGPAAAVPVKTALVSVFDKTGLDDLGAFLKAHNVRILSTGGTAVKLRQLGCAVEDVAEYTGSPEGHTPLPPRYRAATRGCPRRA